MAKIKPKLTKQSKAQLEKLAPPMPKDQPHQAIFMGQPAMDKMTDRQLLEDIWRKMQPMLRFFGKD